MLAVVVAALYTFVLVRTGRRPGAAAGTDLPVHRPRHRRPPGRAPGRGGATPDTGRPPPADARQRRPSRQPGLSSELRTTSSVRSTTPVGGASAVELGQQQAAPSRAELLDRLAHGGERRVGRRAPARCRRSRRAPRRSGTRRPAARRASRAPRAMRSDATNRPSSRAGGRAAPRWPRAPPARVKRPSATSACGGGPARLAQRLLPARAPVGAGRHVGRPGDRADVRAAAGEQVGDGQARPRPRCRRRRSRRRRSGRPGRPAMTHGTPAAASRPGSGSSARADSTSAPSAPPRRRWRSTRARSSSAPIISSTSW